MDMIVVFNNIDWLPITIATLSAFIIGGLWYGPLFGKTWMIENGFTTESLKSRRMSMVFGLSLVLILFAAIDLRMFIGKHPGISFGAMAGFMTGLGWVATFLGIIYLFEKRSFKAFLINAGYSIASLTLMGAILGY
jgi:hypothetical protein